MKNITLTLVAVLMLLVAFNVYAAEKAFFVYSDKNSSTNHFIPSGWMGDSSDLGMDLSCFDAPHSGTTSMKFTYKPKGSKKWVGVYWQSSPNNWGSRKTGYDLSDFNKLTFWAKGAEGGEVISNFKVGGISGENPDSGSAEAGAVVLTDEWDLYTVNLEGVDLSYINGGFCFTLAADQNPDGAVFYLDDIKFSNDPDMVADSGVEEIPFVIYRDKGSILNHGIPSGFMGDYSDIKLDQGANNAYSGDTCIKATYSNAASQGARWVGLYWQNPANNWGSADGGYDLSQASKLSFWVRGEKGGEVIEQFKVGGISGEYADSDVVEIGPVKLEQEWKQYSIDLADRDLSYISGVFCWATNLDSNPDGVVFYLDEIKFE